MTISTVRTESFDKAAPYAKGVGAEGSYVKNCIRHGEIRFAVLSCIGMHGELSVFVFCNGAFDDSLAKTVIFFVYIHKRQA